MCFSPNFLYPIFYALICYYFFASFVSLIVNWVEKRSFEVFGYQICEHIPNISKTDE